MNYVSMQFVLSLIVANCTGAEIMDEHGGIIMVNSRTCNTNNEIYYIYLCISIEDYELLYIEMMMMMMMIE